MEIKTTQEQFEEIHSISDKSRANSKFIKVPKTIIDNLLMDHSEMYDVIEKEGLL